ncbi:centromere protein N-A-like isoform X1 [Asterias amurensis]|uniref:centromere protein N-A-like isoform X1 n=1 Tax=Asterias amurensis TaxID=7602 RepID=UPI003AB357FD
MINSSTESSLRKVLGSFRREEYVTLLKQWGSFPADRLSDVEKATSMKRTAKKALVQHVIQLCSVKNLSKHAVGELELIYQQNHPNSRKWSVFQLTEQAETKEKHHVTTMEEFKERLNKQLSLYFRNDLCIRRHRDAWWIRLGIQEGTQFHRQTASNVVYMVHPPQSQFIILSTIKVSHKDCVMQALLNSLRCSEIREIQLTGRNLDSLASLALNSNSQGWFSQFRLNQVDTNPLAKRPSRKRKAPSSEILDSDIVFENEKEKELRDKQVLHSFGSNEQPKLQKIEYKLETKFRGCEFAPAMSLNKEPFRCRVKFEGTNVLEGIRQLAKTGLVSLPLPHHLGNVHSLAKNHFVLADKKRTRPPEQN